MVAGTPRNEKEALAGMRPYNYIIDIPAGVADIPGDGNTPVAFATTQDIGRFVAGSLDLEHWEPFSGMMGEKKTYNEVADIADKITGRKMLRKYTDIEGLKQKAATETNMFGKFFAQVSHSSSVKEYHAQVVMPVALY